MALGKINGQDTTDGDIAVWESSKLKAKCLRLKIQTSDECHRSGLRVFELGCHPSGVYNHNQDVDLEKALKTLIYTCHTVAQLAAFLQGYGIAMDKYK